jgi:hypothetical protein
MTLRQAQNIRRAMAVQSRDSRIIKRTDWEDSYEIVFSTEDGGCVVFSERCIKSITTAKLAEYTPSNVNAMDGDFLWIGSEAAR